MPCDPVLRNSQGLTQSFFVNFHPDCRSIQKRSLEFQEIRPNLLCPDVNQNLYLQIHHNRNSCDVDFLFTDINSHRNEGRPSFKQPVS